MANTGGAYLYSGRLTTWPIRTHEGGNAGGGRGGGELYPGGHVERAQQRHGNSSSDHGNVTRSRARYHGSFAYITGALRDGEQILLVRLRYGGLAHSFGFAIYSAARDRYEDAVLRTVRADSHA